MDKVVTHSLEHVSRDESFDFLTLQFSNIIIFLLPPNATSVVQLLDQEIIASFSSI